MDLIVYISVQFSSLTNAADGNTVNLDPASAYSSGAARQLIGRLWCLFTALL